MQTDPIPRCPRFRRRRASGFTLVEALLIVAVAGILGTIVFDLSAETLRSTKVAAAGSEVTYVLFQARQRAQTEHTIHFAVVNANADSRIESISLVRDDGSGAYEAADDTVVSRVFFEQDIRIGDGRGNTTSLPTVATDTYALAFGPRGDARHPTSGDPLSAFLNVTSIDPERAGFVKYAGIEISAAGGIRHETEMEAL